MELKANRFEIDSTQYPSWYATLKPLSLKSEIVPLPTPFVEYLKQDGIFLPSHMEIAASSDFSDDEDDEQKGMRSTPDPESLPHFPEFDAAVSAAIRKLGGEVAIKTNWSTPLDVTWMTLGSLKATCLRDVYLQLKSSDRIMYDLEHIYDQCDDDGPKLVENPVLVLRKWANLVPSMEFRIFVRDNTMVGICQRDCCTFYPYMEANINRLADKITSFFNANIVNKSLPNNYCMDVYIDKNDRVWVIDVNCFGLPSSSLLFEWEELQEATSCLVRYVESEGQQMKSSLSMKRGPIDVHMAPEFSRFMEICQQQQQEDDSDSDG